MSEYELPDRCCGCVGPACCRCGEAPCPAPQEPSAPERVEFSRRFTIHRTGKPDIHGVQFPSGRCLYDLPDVGLGAAISIVHVVDEPHTVHWAEADTER